MSVAPFAVLEPASYSLGVSGFIVQQDRAWDVVQFPVWKTLAALPMRDLQDRTFEDAEAHVWSCCVRKTLGQELWTLRSTVLEIRMLESPRVVERRSGAAAAWKFYLSAVPRTPHELSSMIHLSPCMRRMQENASAGCRGCQLPQLCLPTG